MITPLLSEGITISLHPETVFKLGPVPLSNSILLGIVGTSLLIGLLFYTKFHIQRRSYTRLSVAILWAFESLFDTAEDILGSRKLALTLMPLGATLFFFIIINNWLEILPFVGPVTWNGQPLFRGLAADLNVTFALAIVTMITAQIWAIRTHGFFGNIGRYLESPAEGAMEAVADVSRGVTLSMRLFGNIFGGEVILLIIGYLSGFAAPITLPIFMLFELFVGAVQAYIFFMLTIVFISLGTSGGHAKKKPSTVRVRTALAPVGEPSA